MLKESSKVLVTGVTGLIGGELVRSLVRSEVGKIFCVIRPPGAPADRLRHRWMQSGPGEADNRIEALQGDVALPGFGLAESDLGRVTESVDLIIHCASELSFIRDAHCRRTNILGMHNLIDLVRRCRRGPRIVHIGTVAGCGAVSHRCMSETDGSDPDHEHHNEYTRTKAVAEKVLRDSGLPALVLRPSITLSAGVPSRKFSRAIAWFVPLLREFEAMPIDPVSRVDVVPVAYVVECIIALLRRTSLRYDCYNISAGPQGAMLCGSVSEMLDRYYERQQPLRMIPPKQWGRELHRRYINTPERRKHFSKLKYYLPFLNMDVVYDNSRLREELGTQMPGLPAVRQYLCELLAMVGSGEQLAEPVSG